VSKALSREAIAWDAVVTAGGPLALVVDEDEEDLIGIPGCAGIKGLVPSGSRQVRVMKAID